MILEQNGAHIGRMIFFEKFHLWGWGLDVGKGKPVIYENIRSGEEAYEAYVKAVFRK